MPRYVSPSLIARYYFHECERFLRYSATPRAERAAQGVPATPYDTRPVTRAILEGGIVWEERVVTTHLGDRARLAPAPHGTRLGDRIHTVDSTRRLLSTLNPGEYVYQPSLPIVPGLLQRYGLDPSVVTFPDCRPDLIEAYDDEVGRRRLRVIDVKASPGVKLSHRIQATLYTLILEHALGDWDITDRTVSDTGGIWLFGADHPERFDIRSMRPPLETFLETELQPLLAAPANEAAWHVYFRCEWCEYFEHCRAEMRATDDVSRVAYLSTHGKRFLGALTPPVRTVHDLHTVASDPIGAALLDDCASLRGKPDRLARQTGALLDTAVVTHGGASLALPRGENVQLILTIQTEPVSGQVYAWGLYAHGLKDIVGERTMIATRVAATSDAEAIAELERGLVDQLHELLASVHDHNIGREDDWSSQKTLQVFTFDTYERDLLTDILLRRLQDPAAAERALRIFFHFQQPDLVRADSHPANEVFFPIVVVNQVLRSLFALPIEVAYRFGDVVSRLQPSERPFEYRVNDYFAFVLSNQLRSDAIFAVWTKGRTEFVERIERELKARLWATSSLLRGIRERLEGTSALFAWPPKFRLPGLHRLQSAILSRLAFLAQYESVLAYLAIREARMAPLEERLRAHRALRIHHEGGSRYRIDPRHRDADIPRSGFQNWLLVEEGDDGVRASLAYDDYANRARPWVPNNSPVALAAVTDVQGDVDNPNQAAVLDVKWSARLPRARPGTAHILQPRYTDFNTGRVIEELHREDDATDQRALCVLSAPTTALQGSPLPGGVITRARELAQRHGMTRSQLNAFDGILLRNLQLVWGPPGTGKTHFLALAMLCLAEAHRADRLPHRILLTAFTHAAIDNCLRKMRDLDCEREVVEGGLAIAKLARRVSGDDTGIDALDRDGGDRWLAENQVAAIGGTVWGLLRSCSESCADLVVVDEASQVPTPEAVVAIRRVRPAGRLLVAGDHRQLPPIILGTYPDPEPDAPLLHRSIFECITSADGGGTLTATLLENFRMNEVLCRYPAEQVYVPEYRSVDERTARWRLRLSSSPESELEGLVLAPEFPLVVGILDGVQATAENRVEAALVGRLALALRDRLLTGDGSPYPPTADGDRAFWRDGLFIVSPHHAQINAVMRELVDRRAWRSRPFVDTVDKMQGQECDAVIISYGVSDVEYAMNEKEFIYSLNRLNVAITRARAKSIVLLPRPLIEPPIAAYEDDRIAEGVAFMQGLVLHAERHGEVTEHTLADGAALQLLRVPDGGEDTTVR